MRRGAWGWGGPPISPAPGVRGAATAAAGLAAAAVNSTANRTNVAGRLPPSARWSSSATAAGPSAGAAPVKLTWLWTDCGVSSRHTVF